MDALLFMILALVMTIKVSLGNANKVETDDIIEAQEEPANRVAKLNDSFYEDPDAFCDIIHALGFPKEKS